MKNNRLPEIRFAGYKGEWKEYKAADIFHSVSDKNHSNLPVLSATQEKGMVYRDQVGIDIQYDENSTKNYKRVVPGQFVIHLRSFQGGFAFSDIEGITSPAYTVIDFKKREDYYSLFWKYVFVSETFIKRLETVTYGIRDGRSISFSDFSTLKFRVPNYKEQLKIGDFIKRLDDNITIHQQELTTLEQTKKGFLQKMFPKEGESVPEVRFPGFTGDWEHRKLGDITESYSGGTPSVGNELYYGGTIPFIRSAEIKSESTELFITEDGLNNSSAKMVEEGDILYALYGATSGEVGISKINGAINQAILAIKPIFGDDPYFITQWLKKHKNTIISTYLQGGQGNLSGSIVKGLIISLPPHKDEQVKIGEFLKQLDDMISLHKRELKALRETKKAFLQKMFV